MSPPTPPLLDMQGIDKTFGNVPALRGARLTIQPGEVHALIGQNGAGKSTLIKILTGAYAKDAGSIRFDGRDVSFRAPIESQHAGISTIYQELNLLPLRSVAENIFIGREPFRRGLIDWRQVHAQSAAILAQFGMAIDVRTPLYQCNTATQQMTAIARAVSMRAKLIIMDEATSSLDDSEVQTLFGVIRRLKAEGISVLFVSHRLDELYAIGERITVMRDGQTVAERELATFDKFELVSTMLGKPLSALQAPTRKPQDAAGPEALRITHLQSGVRVRDASLVLRRGEMVGLGGLLGSGRTELAQTVFGARPIDGGELSIKGRAMRLRGPADAIACGLAYLSEDRKVEGIVPHLSIQENLTMVLLPKLTRFGMVDKRQQRKVTEQFIQRLGIRCAGPEQAVGELSGGNQQKVLLARWLAARSEVLLLDEPTRGIDIGAKADILNLIRDLTDKEGLSALIIASEIEELIGSSDRITLLRDGVTVCELTGSGMTQAAVMSAMAQPTLNEPSHV